MAHLNRAAYAWLSKFERIWLESYLPSKVLDKNPMKKSKESYNKEDLIRIENAKKIVNGWEKYEKVKGKLIRKTYSTVTKILGEYKRCSKKKRIVHC